MNRLLVILGPTATGKTDLALSLAKKFKGEIVSCDSRQVYKGLDIGTGKLPARDVAFERHERYWMMDGIKVWMYDVVDPDMRYDVYKYHHDAIKAIREIWDKGLLPIAVGGTGLYLKAILSDFSDFSVKPDRELRTQLSGYSIEDLQSKLKSLSSELWNNLNNSEKHNKRRLTRKIEILMSKERINYISERSKYGEMRVLKVGLTARKDVLRQRIDERVVKRVNLGMLEEARELYHKGLSLERMKELGLEYGMLAQYLSGQVDKEKFVKLLQIKIHQYAKRQMTWFAKEEDVRWFDVENENLYAEVEKLVYEWYYGLE